MISETIYKFFSDYIFKASGMVYSEKDYYRLETRIRNLVDILEVETVDDVYQKYQGTVSPDLHAILVNISTNNETFFFRDMKPFKALVKGILPYTLERKPNAPLNLWSCACSTGQEVYSILMAIKDNFSEDIYKRVSVDASDISNEALEKAKKGIFNALEVQRGLPAPKLVAHFEQVEDIKDTWIINKELISRPHFFLFNLINDIYPKMKYDVIFCRNVLIYQGKANKEIILNKIHDSLTPGGIVLLGNGESLIGLETGLERVEFEGLTVFRRTK